MNNTQRTTEIENRIKAALKNVDEVTVIDTSSAHIGHEGAKSGAGHFSVTVVAKDFENLSLVQRHQLIYKAVGDMIGPEIHALSINAKTPA